MGAGEWVAAVVGVLAILETLRRLIRAIYRLVRTGEKALDRLTAVEAELKPNHGSSLRDRVDSVHLLAEDSNIRHARIEGRLEATEKLAGEAARAAGRAATVAATTEQRLGETIVEQRVRHAENVDRLEANDITREFLLGLLRDKYDIDLLPDDDDE